MVRKVTVAASTKRNALPQLAPMIIFVQSGRSFIRAIGVMIIVVASAAVVLLVPKMY